MVTCMRSYITWINIFVTDLPVYVFVSDQEREQINIESNSCYKL